MCHRYLPQAVDTPKSVRESLPRPRERSASLEQLLAGFSAKAIPFLSYNSKEHNFSSPASVSLLGNLNKILKHACPAASGFSVFSTSLKFPVDLHITHKAWLSSSSTPTAHSHPSTPPLHPAVATRIHNWLSLWFFFPTLIWRSSSFLPSPLENSFSNRAWWRMRTPFIPALWVDLCEFAASLACIGSS